MEAIELQTRYASDIELSVPGMCCTLIVKSLLAAIKNNFLRSCITFGHFDVFVDHMLTMAKLSQWKSNLLPVNDFAQRRHDMYMGKSSFHWIEYVRNSQFSIKFYVCC